MTTHHFIITVTQHGRFKFTDDDLLDKVYESLYEDLYRVDISLDSVLPLQPKSGFDASVEAIGKAAFKVLGPDDDRRRK